MRNVRYVQVKHFMLGMLVGYIIKLGVDYATRRRQDQDKLEHLSATLLALRADVLALKNVIITRAASQSLSDQVDEARQSNGEDVFYDTSEVISELPVDWKKGGLGMSLDVEHIDRLFEVETNKLSIYNLLLRHYDQNNTSAEYLWRLAKATFFVSKNVPNREERKTIIFEAAEYARRALEMNEHNGDCHKWFALIIGATCDFVSVKERMKRGKLFKQHLDMAMSLKRNDATLAFMAGRFELELCSISWLERKLATTFFGPLPKATCEQALQYFLQAYELKPEWKDNLYYLGKTLADKGEIEQARSLVDRALAINPATLEDEAFDFKLRRLRDNLTN